MSKAYPSVWPWFLFFCIDLFLGFYYLNSKRLVNNSLSIFNFITAGIFLLITVFLYLFRFPKGRAFLRKIPFKWLQRKVDQYE